MAQQLHNLLDDTLEETSSIRVRPVAFEIDQVDTPTPIHVSVAGYGAFCVGCRFSLGLIPLDGWQEQMQKKGVPQPVINVLAMQLEPMEL